MGFSADRGPSNNLLRLFALICFQKMSQRYNYNSIYLLLFASVVNQNKKIKIAKKNTQNSNIQKIQFMRIPVKM